MGHHFSLTLNREITEQETVTLKENSTANLSFTDAALPTDADIAVTRITFEDEVTTTLAEAIEAGLETVRTIPDITIPGLHVPAQPTTTTTDADTDTDTAADDVAAGQKTKATA
ncbi:hypothetical protein [Streptomyces qinzhouensis]|uniref:Uncharacterized protein n=1 Tax=Streptomyces qinzhouensis TaxID=2599401 RepID=A0A5B8IBX7_9ACTN|nr:hypothetical protein [Streptomyces qinzhouensis]QDY75232.1 hypothetical protein FQU76_00565 [Streptomyces qinzhouensis]